MSCRLSPFFAVFILVLRLESVDSTHARSLMPFDLPEIDGSAVDPCGTFTDPTPVIITSISTITATTTTAPTTTTTPITRKVVTTTKEPAVQSPPRKPDPQNTGTPIRPQPAPAGPITGSHSNAINSLLLYLLANSRHHAAGSLPGMGGLPHKGYSASDSDELAANLLKKLGRRDENMNRHIGSLSSEDSSDES